MSLHLTCALCGRELHRTGVNNDLGCPLHGSRFNGALTEPDQGRGESRTADSARDAAVSSGSVSSPSKPGLRDPDYDFGGEVNVIAICGRWAKLENGDWVTSVPAFKDLNFDAREFDNRIAMFQRDPVGELRAGIVERVPAWKKTVGTSQAK